MSREHARALITSIGILFIVAGIGALFFFGDAGAVPTSRYTKIITHDSSYAKLGARAKRTYSDSLDKSDSVFTRSLKVSQTGRADSLSSRAALITDLLESGYLQVTPDTNQQLGVIGDNLLTFNSISGIFNTGSFFDKCRMWLESSNPLAKFKIEVDSSDKATVIQSTGDYLSIKQDTSLHLKIFPRNFGIAGGMYLGGVTAGPGHSTARLQIEGSNGALGTMPLQIMPGTASGFAVSGGIDNDGRHFFGTDTFGIGGPLVRRAFIQQQDSAYLPIINNKKLVSDTATIDSIKSRFLNSSFINSDSSSSRVLYAREFMFSPVILSNKNLEMTHTGSTTDFKVDSNGILFSQSGVQFIAKASLGGMSLMSKEPGTGNYIQFLGAAPFNAIDMQGITNFYFNAATTGFFFSPTSVSGWPGIGFGHTNTHGTLRGALHFQQRFDFVDDNYVPIVMEPALATAPQDGGIEYNNFSFWGTDTMGGVTHRKEFVRQRDSLKVKTLTVDSLYPCPSIAEWYVDDTTYTKVLTTALVYYRIRVGHAGTVTANIVADSADTSGRKFIFGAGTQGLYSMRFSVSYKSSATDTMHFAVFKNSVKQPNTSIESFVTTAATVNNAGSGGVVRVASGDTVALRVSCTSSGHTLSVNHYNFTAFRIGN